MVRPENILLLQVKNIKAKYKSESVEYIWVCSQLKAVRQDMMIQHIENAFTVDTYETHARIALENGDLNEFNQCQTQLKKLYEKLGHDEKAMKNVPEFVSYRILYTVFLMGNRKYEGGSSDMYELLWEVLGNEGDDVIKAEEVDHALRVRSAVATEDYVTFFKLLDTSPKMSSYLMSLVMPQIRFAGLKQIVKCFKPSVEVDFVVNQLGLSDEEGEEYLNSCKAKVVEGKIVCDKEGFASLTLPDDEEGNLI